MTNQRKKQKIRQTGMKPEIEENSRLGVGVLGGLLKAKSGGGASFGRTRDLSREE